MPLDYLSTKAVRFPDLLVAVDADGIKVLPLERLVERKLASGLSAAHHGKDLVDVQQLSSGTPGSRWNSRPRSTPACAMSIATAGTSPRPR